MIDSRLLDHYLESSAAEAGVWNRSPESAFVDYQMRTWIRDFLAGSAAAAICNVGVGHGEWDDFLCDLMAGRGTVTSVDIDRDCVDLLRGRQARFAHANPAATVCADITAIDLSIGPFDVLTMVGSTCREIGGPVLATRGAWRFLKPGGTLFVIGFEPGDSRTEVVAAMEQCRLTEISTQRSATLPDLHLFCATAKRP